MVVATSPYNSWCYDCGCDGNHDGRYRVIGVVVVGMVMKMMIIAIIKEMVTMIKMVEVLMTIMAVILENQCGLKLFRFNYS